MGIQHRYLWPNLKEGQTQDDVKPIVWADPVVTPEGMRLEFKTPDRYYTPDEFIRLTRFIKQRRAELERVASQGLLLEVEAFDLRTLLK